jgi:hypothetical protein
MDTIILYEWMSEWQLSLAAIEIQLMLRHPALVEMRVYYDVS